MIILLGGRGHIGSEYARQLNLRGARFLTIGRSQCDVYDPRSLANRLRELDASALINCAGYTGKPNVDACERDKANCLAANAVLPGVVAEACQDAGIPWGHVSSGCIYTGRRDDGGGFTEQDSPNFSFRQNNCSFYSGSKALGEEVLADAERCYVWRLRIPFSNIDSGRNYLSKLMRYERLLDAENSLTDLAEFVAATLDCFDKQIPYGIYNLTNPGAVTTREVVEIIRESGIVDREFRFFESEEEFMEVAAATPRSNCVLDVSKALAAGLQLSDVRTAIGRALRNWNSEANVANEPAGAVAFRAAPTK